MTQQSGVGENVWEADQKHNELLQRTADASREISKKYIGRIVSMQNITFYLPLLRFFITEKSCWKTDFLSMAV